MYRFISVEHRGGGLTPGAHFLKRQNKWKHGSLGSSTDSTSPSRYLLGRGQGKQEGTTYLLRKDSAEILTRGGNLIIFVGR